MKRFFVFFLMSLMVSTLVVTASAAEDAAEDPVINGVSRSVVSADVMKEVAAAEEILNEPCKLAEEKIVEDNDFIVVSHLYVPEQMLARSGTRGGVATHTWYKRGASSWSYRAQLGVWFDYDGVNVELSDREFAVVDSSYRTPGYTKTFTQTGTRPLKMTAFYEIMHDSRKLPGALSVACSKDGEITFPDDKDGDGSTDKEI